ncbi:hypothetical protein ABL78_1838 [Leptomonas seymouri]|uniref:Uncharacterized protein n=1 Tax=Leptomonas seymouri TaxID=5684 RepID=A0A0N1PDR9_LEPSE|nr:hypothetical protein ABL78_1838 [Leptomonas seymouri]|eukprot:KPI89025.1 hypothetical protein ABL78_1838 [Leptomonas seymouri]
MHEASFVACVGAAVRRLPRAFTASTVSLQRSPRQPISLLRAVCQQRRLCSTSAPRGNEKDIKNRGGLTGASAQALPLLSSSDQGERCRTVGNACPTAAILTDTDGGAKISLEYCATTVRDTLQTHLRTLLVEQLLMPHLACGFSVEADRLDERGDCSEAAELAINTLAVHSALHGVRQVAFSAMPPRLQHRSWQPLWAAYRTYLLSLSPTAHAPDVNTQVAEDGGGAAVAQATVCMLGREAVRRQLGETRPLFGPADRGAFFHVTTPPAAGDAQSDVAGGAADAPASHAASEKERCFSSDNRRATPAGFPHPLPPLPTALPVPASSVWECFRVDSYVPTFVQLQAAVRHLLRERRPSTSLREKAGAYVQTSRADSSELPARPLSAIALVVPDHLVDVYKGFLTELERERVEACAAITPSSGATCGGPVRLLLFNSAELVCVCHAV